MTRWASPDVISAAISGETAAVERLITAIWPQCFRLAASLIGDRSLAQDAAQESCVIVHRKIASVRSAEAFGAWLYRVVTRESSRVLRGHAGTRALPCDQGSTTDTSSSVDVWRALAELSPPLREVTVLYYFDDLKTEEIAHVLTIAHATVRSRLARARERLRVLLDDYDLEPHPTREEETQHAS
jgi:RNA polymerase sigma-70 factor, ECF subfamily